jgi:integrase
MNAKIAKIDDFVFPSLIKNGKVPVRAWTFVQDHLRPAATSAGVILAKGQRFGLHNLRHSLSTWLVNKGKVDPKTVQGMLSNRRPLPCKPLPTRRESGGSIVSV